MKENAGNHRAHRGEEKNSLCAPKEFPLKDMTERIIGYAIEVHSTLGLGLLESVYEEALAHEFKLRGIDFERQREIEIDYKENMKAMKKKVGLLINFNTEGLKGGIKRLIL